MFDCIRKRLFGPNLPTLVRKDLGDPAIIPFRHGDSRSSISPQLDRHAKLQRVPASRTVIAAAPLNYGARREFRDTLHEINQQLAIILGALSPWRSKDIDVGYITSLIVGLATSLHKVDQFYKQSECTTLGIFTRRIQILLSQLDETQIDRLSQGIKEIHTKANSGDTTSQFLVKHSSFICLESSLKQHCFYQIKDHLADLLQALSVKDGQRICFARVTALKNRLDNVLSDAKDSHQTKHWKPEVFARIAYMYLLKIRLAQLEQISNGLNQAQNYDKVLTQDSVIQDIHRMLKRARLPRLFSAGRSVA